MPKQKLPTIDPLLADDDSENDSDYNPDEDPDYIPDIAENDTSSSKKVINDIGYGRKRKAQELWEEMQQADQAYIESTLNNAISYNGSYYSLEVPMKRAASKLKAFLSGTTVKKTQSNLSKKRLRDEMEEIDQPSAISINDETTPSIREKAKEMIARIKKKVRIEEVRKFAGEEIVMEKMVLQSTTDRDSLNQKQKSKTSVDKALEALKGPKAVNTVQKSSADWGNYKEKEGIQDELAAAAAKNAYIERKEFLDRCDYRNFEQERDERLQKMATRK